MARILNEQLYRMYSLIYGKEKLNSKLNSIREQAEKAELVTDDVTKFFDNLKNVKTPLSQQQRGQYNFQKDVETVQIALILLGYELPRFGVDGLFGPETARAVEKFKKDNDLTQPGTLNESRLIRILNELEMVQLADTSYSNVKFDNDATQYDSVNKALLDDLQKAAEAAGIVATITTAKSGHGQYVKNSDRVSRHMSQTAVDIAILNGIGSGGATNKTNGNPEFRELGNKLKDALVALGYTLNSESGNDKAVLWQTDTGGNHYNHLHVSNKAGVSDAELNNFTSGGSLS
ncbi:MAG: putative peptidoglycan binding domain, partial [Bacteroidota bacterium]